MNTMRVPSTREIGDFLQVGAHFSFVIILSFMFGISLVCPSSFANPPGEEGQKVKPEQSGAARETKNHGGNLLNSWGRSETQGWEVPKTSFPLNLNTIRYIAPHRSGAQEEKEDSPAGTPSSEEGKVSEAKEREVKTQESKARDSKLDVDLDIYDDETTEEKHPREPGSPSLWGTRIATERPENPLLAALRNSASQIAQEEKGVSVLEALQARLREEKTSRRFFVLPSGPGAGKTTALSRMSYGPSDPFSMSGNTNPFVLPRIEPSAPSSAMFAARQFFGIPLAQSSMFGVGDSASDSALPEILNWSLSQPTHTSASLPESKTEPDTIDLTHEEVLDKHKDDQCMICLSKFAETVNDATKMGVVQLKCGGQHKFCKDCFNTWYKEQQVCPLCKEHIKPKPPSSKH